MFNELYALNVNEYVEKKNGLSYLTWSFAWAEVMKKYPEATYTIEKFNGLPYVYDPMTGYMVYTTVTIEGITREMWLPVMDGANKAMKAEPYTYSTKYGDKTVEAATMFDINKTIMRCLVKNLAMFGLGLYIYAGEDLPEDPAMTKEEKREVAIKESYQELEVKSEFIKVFNTMTAEDQAKILRYYKVASKKVKDMKVEDCKDYLDKRAERN